MVRAIKFPPDLAKLSVRPDRVNWDAVRPWVAKRVTELLGGVEDDVLIAYVCEQLEGKKVGAVEWGCGRGRWHAAARGPRPPSRAHSTL